MSYIFFEYLFETTVPSEKDDVGRETRETEGDGRQEGDVACRLYDVTV